MKPLLLFITGVLLFATPCYAQIEDCGTYRDTINALVTGRDAAGNAVPPAVLALLPARLSSAQNNAYCFAVFVVGSARLNASVFEQFVKRFEGSRTDKQTSASGGGAGTTSLVSQGPAAKVLSAAVEYGALTRSVEESVVTLRGNLAGLPSALVRKNVFPYCPSTVSVSEFCFENSVLSWLRRVSLAVSFDTKRGTEVAGTPESSGSTTDPAKPVTFTADRRQISGASARLEVWNRRDVTSKEFQDNWKMKVAAAMERPAADLNKSAGDFVDTFLAFPEYAKWQMDTAAAIDNVKTDRAAIVMTLRTALDQLLVTAKAKAPDFESRAADALAAYSRFFLAQDDLIASLSTKNVLAVEYTFSQPTGQVATDNYRAIFDLPLTTRTKLVANGAFTRYRELPAGAPADSEYRDAQAGVQLEHGLGSQSIVGPALVTVAAYYQYQHAPSLLKIDPVKPLPGITFTGLPADAKTVFTKTGDIFLAQAKLVLTPTGSSVKIPLSVTYATKTELVDRPVWRGQVGLAYDFDALLGALR